MSLHTLVGGDGLGGEVRTEVLRAEQVLDVTRHEKCSLCNGQPATEGPVESQSVAVVAVSQGQAGSEQL